jgi:hypothetical protein
VDYSGRHRPGSSIQGVSEIGNETGHAGTRRTSQENGCGYWLGLFDAIKVTGLSR